MPTRKKAMFDGHMMLIEVLTFFLKARSVLMPGDLWPEVMDGMVIVAENQRCKPFYIYDACSEETVGGQTSMGKVIDVPVHK